MAVQENYNDNAVQYGSRTVIIKRGQAPGTALTGPSGGTAGTRVLENITINRPSGVVTQSTEVGKANGFAIVDGVQVTGSCVIQLGWAANQTPRAGDWFEDTFDSNYSTERFVIHSLGQTYDAGTTFKQSASLIKAHYTSVTAPT